MPFYAHTHPAYPDPKDAAAHWEPLFTPFGEADDQCQRDTCQKCKAMPPNTLNITELA